MYSWISPKSYPNHKRFRVWCKKLDGTKTYETFDTAEQAQVFIETAQSKLLSGGHPIEKVIDQYLASKAPNVKASTLATLGFRLRSVIKDRKRFPVEGFVWKKAGISW